MPSVKGGGFSTIVSPGGGYNPFTMRVDQAPFDDKRVRQAMAWSVDRAEMMRLVFDGYGTLGNDLYSIWDRPSYDTAIPQREQDIDKAKFLLKQAGYSSGLTVELVTAPFAQGVIESAEVLAQQARQAGITISIKQLTTTDFYGPGYLSYVFAMDTWNYLPFFPQSAIAFASGATYNETHFHDTTFSALYLEALRTVDTAKRADIAHEMQAIFWDACPYLIPNYPPLIDAFNPKLHGDVPSKTGNPFNNFNFKQMWFD
jgi:peptide/nickel transport system substrate-binding protein